MIFLIRQIIFYKWWSTTERAGEPVQPDLPAARDHWLRALRGPGRQGNRSRGVRGEDVPALQADQVQRNWHQYLVNEIKMFFTKNCDDGNIPNVIKRDRWVSSTFCL